MYAYFDGILVSFIFYLSFTLYLIHILSQTLRENQLLNCILQIAHFYANLYFYRHRSKNYNANRNLLYLLKII